MVKPLVYITLMLCFVFAGCTTPTVVTKTIFQTVKVPVVEVPAPPVVEKPVLAITTLSAEDQADIGLLTQSYVVTIKQLEDYADQLNLVISQYAQLAKQNPVIETPPNK